MSIITKGFVNNTIITRGFTKSLLKGFKGFAVAIFLNSKVEIAMNIVSRVVI